jgi:DNA ligase-1
MLAADLFDNQGNLHLEWIHYPVLATPKIDGIRCLAVEGCARTRSMKLIPNTFIRVYAEGLTYQEKEDGDWYADYFLDGELITFTNGQMDKFAGKPNGVESKVMSYEGRPDFRYMVFDCVDLNHLNQPYQERVEKLADIPLPTWLTPLFPVQLNNQEELEAYEQECLDQGFEGICFRSPNSPYKQGRSTVRQGWLVKLKRYEKGYAIVTGFEEKMQNDNPSYVNELGLTSRSQNSSGLIPAGTLGSFWVKDTKTSAVFKVSPGNLTAAQKQHIWDNKDQFLRNKMVYKFFPIGDYNNPRHPTFLEWVVG